MPQKFYLGDIVRMRKPHPCGDDRWEVMRTGMDFRMKCLGCGRVVMLPRRKFERGVKEILKRGVDEEVKRVQVGLVGLLTWANRPCLTPSPGKAGINYRLHHQSTGVVAVP